MKWIIIFGCFYLAWGGILYLDRTEAELEDWRKAAEAHALLKGAEIPSRSHLEWGMLLLLVCWWPFMRRASR